MDILDGCGGCNENVNLNIGSGITLAATQVIVNDGAAIPVTNSVGTITVTGTANVAAGVLTNVSLPATDAIVTNAEALVVPVTGVIGTTATFTVAGGVITGIVLS